MLTLHPHDQIVPFNVLTVRGLRLNVLHLYFDNSFHASFAVTFLSVRHLSASVDRSHFVWILLILDSLGGEFLSIAQVVPLGNEICPASRMRR